MEKIILEINELINKIDIDTSKKDIVGMSHKLIELAKYQGEYNKKLLQKKTERDIKHLEAKEGREKALIKDGKDKISDAELTRWADSQVKDIKQDIGDYQGILDWLQPLMTAYYNYINSVKFEDRLNNDTTRCINNINNDPF